MLHLHLIFRLFSLAIAFLVGATVSGYVALAEAQEVNLNSCEEVNSSPDIKFDPGVSKKTQMPTNSGVVVPGFVSVPGKYLNGVDVSKYENRVDFLKIVKCGAKFVYVRLSSGRTPSNELEYLEHWGNARSVGLTLGPYHNITLSIGSSLTEGNVENVIRDNIIFAEAQAVLFADRLQQVLSKDIPEKCGGGTSSSLGCPYLPAVLDASLRPKVGGTASEKRLAGRVYVAAICSWIQKFKRDPRFLDQPVVLFTFPDVYLDYDFSNSSCELDHVDIWLSSHQPAGGYPLDTIDSRRDAIRQICNIAPDGKLDSIGRCKFHQYTSNGMFANFNEPAGIDLNRFYGSESEISNLLQYKK